MKRSWDVQHSYHAYLWGFAAAQFLAVLAVAAKIWTNWLQLLIFGFLGAGKNRKKTAAAKKQEKKIEN